MRLDMRSEAPPEWLERAANEGRWHEQRIKDELRADDIAVYDEQSEYVLEYDTFRLVGHIDGRVNNHGNEMLLEIKSMSQYEFDRWIRGGFKEFPEYADQLACYVTATGLENCLYIVKNRSSGYEDRRICFDAQDDAAAKRHIDVIVNKLTAIEDWLSKNIEVGAREGVYPADFDPTSLECRRCEYKYLCIKVEKLSPVAEKVLVDASAKWREGKRLEAQADSLISEAREVLEQHVRTVTEKRFMFNGLSTALISVHKETYDRAKLEQIFMKEELKPALKIQDYEQVRITDLAKESSSEN